MQGAASGLINTTAYSFAASAYADNVEKVIAVMEAIVGVGCTIGPVLGSVVYDQIGFEWTFITFGAAMAPSCILSCCLAKPGDIKKKRE